MWLQRPVQAEIEFAICAAHILAVQAAAQPDADLRCSAEAPRLGKFPAGASPLVEARCLYRERP